MVVPEVLICLNCCLYSVEDDVGVSWICGVMVLLSMRVCNVCLSPLMNIIFDLFPYLFCFVRGFYIDV